MYPLLVELTLIRSEDKVTINFNNVSAFLRRESRLHGCMCTYVHTLESTTDTEIGTYLVCETPDEITALIHKAIEVQAYKLVTLQRAP